MDRHQHWRICIEETHPGQVSSGNRELPRTRPARSGHPLTLDLPDAVSWANNAPVRRRRWLWVSLGLNVALAAWVAHLLRAPEPAPTVGPFIATPIQATNLIRTNVVVRRQNFVWSQIESDDYPTYIANLRRIGCPEPTIRDIIVADVNQLFARRRATEVVTAQQQWWRSDPDPGVSREAIERVRSLEDERRSLLTKLLGPEWESADYPLPSLASLTVLDGPILGTLPPETKLKLQRIEQDSLDRQLAYLRLQQDEGEPADPAEVARMRRQTRDELAKVLTPSQLEEYLLRYSNNANQLRARLRGFDATPEEFRTLFRIADPIDEALQQLPAGGSDPESTRRRQELEQGRDTAIQQALGSDRYQDYKVSQDPLYRQARALAEEAGVAQDKILPLAVIYRLTDLEEQKIRGDTSLTAEEQTERLAAARTAQQNSLRQLLGEDAFKALQDRQTNEADNAWIPPLPQPSQ